MAGLFDVTPQAVMQQQAERARQMGMQRAGLPAGRGMVASAGQAGGAFGQALGQAVGGQSPEMVKAQKRQAIKAQMDQSGIDLSQNPREYFKQLGKYASEAGDSELSMIAHQQLSEVRKEDREERRVKALETPKPSSKGLTGGIKNILAGRMADPSKATPAQIKAARETYQKEQVALRKAGVPASLVKDLTTVQSMPVNRHAIKIVSDLEDNISKIYAILDKPNFSSQDEGALNQLMSTLANTGVRAASEVASFRNRGDLPQRFSGAISRFFTGTGVESQLTDIRSTVDAFHKDVVLKSKADIASGMSTILMADGNYTQETVDKGVSALFGKGQSRDVVRTGTNSKGQRVIQYSDGTVEVQ